MEDDRVIDLHLRNGPYFNNSLGDDAEIALVAQDHLQQVRPGTNSWDVLAASHSALACNDLEIYKNVVDIAVPILFHATGSSADPSTESAVLNRVWLMPTHDTLLSEFLLHVSAHDSSLDAGTHIVLVNPLHVAEPA